MVLQPGTPDLRIGPLSSEEYLGGSLGMYLENCNAACSCGWSHITTFG